MTPKKRLRSGFTTGACAAAAARAAAEHLVRGQGQARVAIPFPDGVRRDFAVHWSTGDGASATGAVIKDAGDDPDVTNGAEIVVTLRPAPVAEAKGSGPLIFRAGDGVGLVTKPGLPVAVGEPAINPVPREMIAHALADLLPSASPWEVTVGVTNGRSLAERTLNHRLGIVGGLSILGTTGIVRPISAAAWTATIVAGMEVAWHTGCREVVLSTGRTSEKGVQALLSLPEEAYAMMGDYLKFSLDAARERGFARIHLAVMWAKAVKAAMEIPQTHVRHGAIEVEEAAAFISRLTGDPAVDALLAGANTVREIYDRLRAAGADGHIHAVCRAAKRYAETTSRLPVTVYLVESPGRVVDHV